MQNPYEPPQEPQPSPSPFETPPPANSPTSPANSPAPRPSRSGTVSTEVISEAWQLLQPQLGMWVVAGLIVLAISGGVNTLTSVFQLPFASSDGSAPTAAYFLVTIIGQILSFVVSTITGAALIKMALHQLRTGRADLSAMFSVGDVVVPLLIGGILTTLITFGGFLLCIIPGIIAALGLAMTTPLIVDQKLDAMAAISRSWEVMKPNIGSFFVVSLVLTLINVVGFCACCIGLLVTIPLTYIAIALIYRDLFLEGVVTPQITPTDFTPPPIASPNG